MELKESELLKVEQVAKILQISRGHAYGLVHRADFPSIKIGRCLRIPLQALELWITRQAAKGNGSDGA